jgi:hypothetical protein
MLFCYLVVYIVAIGEGNILGCFCRIYGIIFPSEALKVSVSLTFVNKVMLISGHPH